jgi:DNA-binding transcriptional LysR family regulator
LRAPLLHLSTRPDAWETWLSHHRVPFETVHGMLFDQFGTMVEAARAGLGAALLPRFLIARELEQGQLVEAVEAEPMPTGHYFLAYPPDRATYAPLASFRDWITEEIEQDEVAKRMGIGQ